MDVELWLVDEHLALREADSAGQLLQSLLATARSLVGKDGDDNGDSNDIGVDGLTGAQRSKLQNLVPGIADTIASSLAPPLLAELQASQLVTPTIQA